MTKKQYLMVFCTCPNRDSAERIASTVVEERLAACVNILSEVTSIYKWQGQPQIDKELLLIIKTQKEIYSALEARIRALHPYAVAEVIALPIAQGSAAYLDWIGTSTGDDS